MNELKALKLEYETKHNEWIKSLFTLGDGYIERSKELEKLEKHIKYLETKSYIKIYSSKAQAIKNITKDHNGYYIQKACTGGYKTSISEWTDSDNLLAVYKSYRSNEYEKYCIIYGIYRNGGQ